MSKLNVSGSSSCILGIVPLLLNEYICWQQWKFCRWWLRRTCVYPTNPILSRNPVGVSKSTQSIQVYYFWKSWFHLSNCLVLYIPPLWPGEHLWSSYGRFRRCIPPSLFETNIENTPEIYRYRVVDISPDFKTWICESRCNLRPMYKSLAHSRPTKFHNNLTSGEFRTSRWIGDRTSIRHKAQTRPCLGKGNRSPQATVSGQPADN